MSEEMAALIAKRFIQRRDVKARQSGDGSYHPVTNCPGGSCTHENDSRLPFRMSDIMSHLNREQTFGHYLVDQEDKCKLFAFDIDLEKNIDPTPRDPEGFTGVWCELPDISLIPDEITDERWQELVKYHGFDARESWADRAHPSRAWVKMQLRVIAEKLSSTIKQEFDLPVACAYSGSKGLHVYGFTGSVPAHEAREAAELVLNLIGEFQAHRGASFFKTIDQTPLRGFPNLSIEVFPKQVTLDGKDLGNLMRLPLGRNMKTKDPTFFLDQRAPLGQIAPHPDPISLLKNGNPWS